MLQKSDTINYNGKTINIFSQPLEQYFDETNRPNLICFKPEMVSRGYFADWQIENNRLYLINFEGHLLNNLTEEVISSINLFHTNKNIFANWFTGEINIPYDNEDYPIPKKLIKLNFINGSFVGEKMVG